MSEYAIPRAGQELYQCSRTDKYQLKALHHFEQFVRHIPCQTVASISFVNFENVETKHVGHTWTKPGRIRFTINQVTIRSTEHQDRHSL